MLPCNLIIGPLQLRKLIAKEVAIQLLPQQGNVSSWSLDADIHQTVVCPSFFFFFFFKWNIEGSFLLQKRLFMVKLAHKGKEVLLVCRYAQTYYWSLHNELANTKPKHESL